MLDGVKYALIIRLRSTPGKEAEVERLIRRCLRLAREEPTTVASFGMRLDATTFGVFSAFQNEAGLEQYLSRYLRLVLEATTAEILAEPSLIEQVEILEAKI